VHDKYLCVFWSGSVTMLIPDDVKKLCRKKVYIMWPQVQVLGVTGIKKVQVHLFLLKIFDHKESNSSKPKIGYNQNTWPNYQKGPIIQ